jgi:hypothetical protein
MFIRIGILGMLIFIAASCSGPTAEEVFEDLKQLEGKWQTNEGPEFTEEWLIENDSLLSGRGITMKGNEVAFEESLKLYRAGQWILYAAKPGQQSDFTFFRLEESRKNYWKFVNPVHDYPNVIEYRLKNETTLEAKTTNLKGKQEVLFIMKRIE